MTGYQTGNGSKTHRRAGHTPFSRMIDDLMNINFGEALEGVFTVNRALINVHETDVAYELHVAAPGLSKSDFRLEVKEDVLHISAHHEENPTVQYKSREFDFGRFTRTFKLGGHVDSEAISANYENGILRVQLPKREQYKKGTEIPVQ